MAAVRGCWVSLWTARAIGYRHRLGIEPGSIAMGVIVQMLVPAEPTGPSRVRQWMSVRLREWSVPEPVISAAILCTSELTTNALLHAGTPAQVHVDLNAERLLVSVADTGTRGTVIRAHADTLSSGGRGRGLIEDLSDSWGTDPTVRGTTVWFEMLLPGAPDADALPSQFK